MIISNIFVMDESFPVFAGFLFFSRAENNVFGN